MNSAKKLTKQSVNTTGGNKSGDEQNPKSRTAIGIIVGLGAALVILIGFILWEDLHPRLILTVNDEKIYLSDMMFDIYMTEQTGDYMDNLYRQNYGSSYWDAEAQDGQTNGEMLKDNTINAVMQRAMMYDEAIEKGYTLTEEEQTTVEDNATSAFDQMTADVKNRTGLTKNLIKEYYERKTLADRYKADWIDSFDIDDAAVTAEISKEDYRQYDIQYYYIPYKKTDENGQSVDMSDDEIKKAKEELGAAYDDIKSLEDFSTYIDNSSDAAASGDSAEPTATPAPGPKAPADTNIKYTTKSFIEKDEVSDFDTVLLSQIKSMKNDQISDRVLEDSNGCYIFKMVNNNSTERYDSECQNAITTKENEVFQEKIDELEVDKYLIEVNDDEWDKIIFGKTTIN